LAGDYLLIASATRLTNGINFEIKKSRVQKQLSACCPQPYASGTE